MAQETPRQNTASASENNVSVQKSIDLNKLAEKIVALLRREISIETERIGK